MAGLQTEFPRADKQNELEKAAAEYVEHHHVVQKHKEEMKPIAEKILTEMKKTGRLSFAIPYNDGRLKFEMTKKVGLKVSGFSAKKAKPRARRG